MIFNSATSQKCKCISLHKYQVQVHFIQLQTLEILDLILEIFGQVLDAPLQPTLYHSIFPLNWACNIPIVHSFATLLHAFLKCYIGCTPPA